PVPLDEVHIKVGFSKVILKRLNEWEGQYDERGNQYVNGAVSLLKGTFKPGEAVKYPRRIEKLIHMELEDVAANSLHLNPEFMYSEEPGDRTTASRRKSSKIERKSCIDCGAVHREIFAFKRITSGKLKGKEWESIVKPIMEKWGSFVAEYL
ncbi:hypothetical protein FRC06_000872, partial [Ceratobasidium sp. 370]